MSGTEAEPCFICGKTGHEYVMAFGTRIVSCPAVPEGFMVPGREYWEQVVRQIRADEDCGGIGEGAL
jgi:hypothetical protein